MNQVALVALKLGLISPEMRAQFAQWGEVPEVAPIEISDPKEVDEMLEQAQYDAPLPKVTSLDLIAQFCATQRLGKLHLEVAGQRVCFEVVFGVTPLGDLIIPWKSEDIRDVLLDTETTYLEWSDSRTTDAVLRATFKDVEDIYYGDVKAFMLCAVREIYGARIEDDHGEAQ